MFVIDCSVTMAWLFEDEKTPFSEKIFDLLETEKAISPSLWPIEIVNVLLQGEKRRRITPSQSAHFLNTLNQLPIQVIENSSTTHFESWLYLARENNLTSYDAAYLDLASRMGLPLATLDMALIKAAKSLGVELLS